jgi:hypothetical protein
MDIYESLSRNSAQITEIKGNIYRKGAKNTEKDG